MSWITPVFGKKAEDRKIQVKKVKSSSSSEKVVPSTSRDFTADEDASPAKSTRKQITFSPLNSERKKERVRLQRLKKHVSTKKHGAHARKIFPEGFKTLGNSSLAALLSSSSEDETVGDLPEICSLSQELSPIKPDSPDPVSPADPCTPNLLNSKIEICPSPQPPSGVALTPSLIRPSKSPEPQDALSLFQDLQIDQCKSPASHEVIIQFATPEKPPFGRVKTPPMIQSPSSSEDERRPIEDITILEERLEIAEVHSQDVIPLDLFHGPPPDERPTSQLETPEKSAKLNEKKLKPGSLLERVWQTARRVDTDSKLFQYELDSGLRASTSGLFSDLLLVKQISRRRRITLVSCSSTEIRFKRNGPAIVLVLFNPPSPKLVPGCSISVHFPVFGMLDNWCDAFFFGHGGLSISDKEGPVNLEERADCQTVNLGPKQFFPQHFEHLFEKSEGGNENFVSYISSDEQSCIFDYILASLLSPRVSLKLRILHSYFHRFERYHLST